jgi:hypothetical protein
MRRRGIPCSAMYAVLLATLVNAGAADAKAQKLRLSPEYIAHLCQANSFKRAEGIRRFASEFGDGYRPAAYELAEVLRNPLPCEQGYVQPPTDFRCRLDRVIFRDAEKGEKFAANAASYKFQFEYEPYVFKGRPRPIGDDKMLNQVFGDITVRGTYKGKRVYLSQSWIKGTPTYLVSSSSDGNGSGACQGSAFLS